MGFLCTICEININHSKSYGFIQYWWTNFIVGTLCFTAHTQYCSIADSSQFIYNNIRSSVAGTFNIWRFKISQQKILSLMQYKTIRFGMVYVDFTKHNKQNQISSNLSFNTDIFWRFQYKALRVVGALVGYYRKSCFVGL